MSARSSFHRNVFLLTQVIPPSKEFQKYFKEGMFDKANTAGFLHVSHYLLTIYDDERFKRAVEWPILDKRGEAKYRNDVKDFLTIVTNENEDIECPSILASYLFTASGTKFMTLMWKLSQIVLRSYLKRTVGPVLGAPKPGNAEPLTKLFFNNIIAEHEVRIKEIDERMKKTENQAREIVKETVQRIETVQSELFEARKRLIEIAENSNVHADIRKRIINTKDGEVIELWKKNIQLGTDYLRQQIKLVRNIEEKSTKVNNLVMSLFSDTRQILDGTNLPRLNVAKLMDLPLEPEAQVALHHSYVEEKLSLNNFLILLNSVLEYFYVNLKKSGFPNLFECKLQIQASTEDLKKMCTVIDQIQNKVTHISNELKTTASSKSHNIHSDTLQNHYSDNMYTVLLEASPTIQFNTIDHNSERHDGLERLKLTPVEIQYKPFARYKAKRDAGDPFTTPVRPKVNVSRINFDETLLSPSSAKFGAIPKRIASTKPMNQSIIGTRVPEKYARLFGARSGILANSSMASTSSWKASTFIEGHNGGNIHNLSDIRGNGSIYNMSDLRVQLARTSSANVSLDLPTPIKFSSQCPNAPPNTLAIKDIEKPAFNSSEMIPDLQTISETTEINMCTQMPKKSANEVGKRTNRRLSIGDLVERYKKVRDQSICTPKFNFETEPNIDLQI